jgi:hypothetical protein
MMAAICYLSNVVPVLKNLMVVVLWNAKTPNTYLLNVKKRFVKAWIMGRRSLIRASKGFGPG